MAIVNLLKNIQRTCIQFDMNYPTSTAIWYGASVDLVGCTDDRMFKEGAVLSRQLEVAER